MPKDQLLSSKMLLFNTNICINLGKELPNHIQSFFQHCSVSRIFFKVLLHPWNPCFCAYWIKQCLVSLPLQPFSISLVISGSSFMILYSIWHNLFCSIYFIPKLQLGKCLFSEYFGQVQTFQLVAGLHPLIVDIYPWVFTHPILLWVLKGIHIHFSCCTTTSLYRLSCFLLKMVNIFIILNSHFPSLCW